MKTSLIPLLGLCLWPLFDASANPISTQDIAATNRTIEQKGMSWTAGETRFTRMSAQERSRYVMPQGARLPWLEFLERRPNDLDDSAVPRDYRGTGIDWRNNLGYNWDTPIRDQGDCGSCWAFATIAALELLISWRDSTPDPVLDLSEQQLFDCSMDSIDCATGGITWYTTGSFLSQTGVTSEECYPYLSGDNGAKGNCPVAAEMSSQCQQAIVRVEDLTELTDTTPGWPWWDPPEFTMSDQAMADVKAYLHHRPVGTSYRVFNDFYSYTGGIYEPTTTAGGEMHAVLIVGYDDTDQCWIVKNSWGDDFGEDGYFRIRYNTSSFGMFSFVYHYDEDRAAAAFCSDLPSSLELNGAQVGSHGRFLLANCGGGGLVWTVAEQDSWFEMQDSRGNAVQTGVEVAAGRIYRVSLVQEVPDGSSGVLSLLSAEGEQVDIEVRASNSAVFDGGQDGDPADGDGGSGDAEPGDGDILDGGDESPGSRSSGGCSTASGGVFSMALLLLASVLLLRRLKRKGGQ